MASLSKTPKGGICRGSYPRCTPVRVHSADHGVPEPVRGREFPVIVQLRTEGLDDRIPHGCGPPHPHPVSLRPKDREKRHSHRPLPRKFQQLRQEQRIGTDRGRRRGPHAHPFAGAERAGTPGASGNIIEVPFILSFNAAEENLLTIFSLEFHGRNDWWVMGWRTHTLSGGATSSGARLTAPIL